MARYEVRRRGVFDRDLARVIEPGDPAWADYLAHLRDELPVDPMPPEERLEPIEKRRARVLDRIGSPLRVADARPYTIGAGSFRLDRFEAQMVIDACAISAAGGSPPSPFTLFDLDGTPVALSPANLRNLAEKILARRLRVYLRRRELEQAVAASDDPEALDLEGGWEEPA